MKKVGISEVFEHLETKALGRNCFYLCSLDSTSTYIRNNLNALRHGHTVIALEQGSGRGRSGKSFYSPKNNGLYFSFLLTEEKYTKDPLFTVKISLAVCKAIDETTGTDKAKIKWVNDIYAVNKKIAGILCEAVETNGKRGIIVGVGVNLHIDKDEIPDELKGKIGSIEDLSAKGVCADKLCAAILNQTEGLWSGAVSDMEFHKQYRIRSAVLGREIKVLKNNEELRAAALDIAPDGGLLVRYASGITEKLTAGEISILV